MRERASEGGRARERRSNPYIFSLHVLGSGFLAVIVVTTSLIFCGREDRGGGRDDGVSRAVRIVVRIPVRIRVRIPVRIPWRGGGMTTSARRPALVV